MKDKNSPNYSGSDKQYEIFEDSALPLNNKKYASVGTRAPAQKLRMGEGELDMMVSILAILAIIQKLDK